MRGIRSAGIGVVIALGVLSQAPARAAGSKCADVHVEHHYPTFTTGVAAERVRATGTTCRRARHIAKIAAKEALRKGEDHIRKTIDGFHVVVELNCDTCTPRWPVTATKPGARVTFVLLGGA